MAKRVASIDLPAALRGQLEGYNGNLVKRLNRLSESTAAHIAKRTKQTAPKRTGAYRRSITSGIKDERPLGNIYAWYVKPPHYRLTHLLAHGHALRGGGRTRPNPFLADAVNAELPQFETDAQKAVKEATHDA